MLCWKRHAAIMVDELRRVLDELRAALLRTHGPQYDDGAEEKREILKEVDAQRCGRGPFDAARCQPGLFVPKCSKCTTGYELEGAHNT